MPDEPEPERRPYYHPWMFNAYCSSEWHPGPGWPAADLPWLGGKVRKPSKEEEEDA